MVLQASAFDFLIKHRKGSENVVAHMLSRVVEEVEVEDNDGILGFEMTEFESPEYKELREDVEANKDKLPDVRVVDGLIFKRTQRTLAVESLKIDLAAALVLVNADFKRYFFIQYNGSWSWSRAMLFRRDEDGQNSGLFLGEDEYISGELHRNR